jgi:hypothetical protein
MSDQLKCKMDVSLLNRKIHAVYYHDNKYRTFRGLMENLSMMTPKNWIIYDIKYRKRRKKRMFLLFLR